MSFTRILAIFYNSIDHTGKFRYKSEAHSIAKLDIIHSTSILASNNQSVSSKSWITFIKRKKELCRRTDGSYHYTKVLFHVALVGNKHCLIVQRELTGFVRHTRFNILALWSSLFGVEYFLL